MKWLTISKKAGRQIFRERLSLFFMMLFPLLFILIFGVAFGSFDEGNITYDIAVINHDGGIELDDTNINHGETLIDVLTGMRYQDKDGKNTSKKVFNLRTDLSEKKVQELVEDRDIDAYVVIPANFSEAVFADSMRYVESAVASGIQDRFEAASGTLNLSDPAVLNAFMGQLLINMTGSSDGISSLAPEYDKNATAVVYIQGDPGQSSYFTVASIIESVTKGYVDLVGSETLDHVRDLLPVDYESAKDESRVRVTNKALEATEFTSFDYVVPGMIVFALLMSAMTVTIFMAQEETRGTLARLKLTKMTSFDLLFGTSIPFLIIAVGQILILLGTALVLGFHYNANANLGLALLIAVIGAAASVALGLILAAIAKNEEQAGSIGPAVTVPLSFLTGAFFPMPSVILSDNFLGTGKTFEIFDWLPWTQCSKALSKVLIYGSSFEEVKVDMALLITFTIIFFIIGVILYHNRRLRAI